MRGLVKRSSFVVILTTINSHQGVQLAKRLARKQNRPFVVMKRCGQSGFRQFLAEIDRHDSKFGRHMKNGANA